jgi:glycosyltransferase involved in cell wall biosynthesis
MKIIQANKFYYPRGGAETYMLSLSRWLDGQGHEVVPFAMRHPENLQTEFEKYFVSEVKTDGTGNRWQNVRTFARMMYSLEARRKLATLIAEQKPDLCHVHNIYTQISPSILHTLSDQHVPAVMTVHDHHLISPQYNIWAQGCGQDHRRVGIVRGTFSKFHKNSMAASFVQVTAYKFHRWLRMYEKHMELFIVPSAYLKRQLVAGGFPAEKIRVNHYGIDAHSVEPTYQHNGYFLFVGRLSEEKGVDMIVHIAKLLPDIRFKIVGRGPQMEYLHRFAIETPNVEFSGFRSWDELRDLYRGACAVLLPSRVHEVFPLVILEAMSAGKPVIASNVGGVPEVIEDRVSGWLVEPTDLHGWIEALLRLYHDANFYSRLCRGAREAVEHKFSLDDHYRRLLNIYQEVLPRHL